MDFNQGVAVAVGLTFVALALIAGAKKKQPLHLADAAVIFLSGAGAVAGYEVCRTALQLGCLPKEQAVPVFLGGLVLIWVGGEALLTKLTAKPKS